MLPLRNSLAPSRTLHSLWPLLAALAACGGAESQKSVTVLTDPDAGSGGSDQVAADAGGTEVVTGQTCMVSPAQVRSHRSCNVDADCELLAYRSTCCATQHIVGIAREDSEALHECVARELELCECAEQPDRADDGRASVGDDVEVHCVDNQCKSSIATRRCGGELLCSGGDVCVAYENLSSAAALPGTPSTGSNSLYTYACVRNPCKGSLNCSCAQTACEARTDVMRVCAVEFSAEADVSCSRFKD